MAKVIQAFRERYHDMKLYRVGDEYPGEDKERVQYLTAQGFLEDNDASAPLVPSNLEEFSSLSAPDQKRLLAFLEIQGDDGNAEKRDALFSAYLASVNGNADPDA